CTRTGHEPSRSSRSAAEGAPPRAAADDPRAGSASGRPIVRDASLELPERPFEGVEALRIPPGPGLDHQLHELVPGSIDLPVIPRTDAPHRAAVGQHGPAPAVEVQNDSSRL